MDKVILHIDFDSYFASVEQQYNVSLRGKAIGVTAQNGRTCIIAASREAKKMGIKSPSRTFDALQIVPNMIFVPANFNLYWEITRKFINICKDYTPYIELFSLDEVFMDITSTIPLFKDKHNIIKRIRERIKNEIGEYITVSVGISYNKLLAKLGSGMNKPNGLAEITPGNLNEIYKKVKLTDFCGIGERVALRLKKIGIYSPLELRDASLGMLKEEFGNAEANFLKNLSNGVDESPIISYTDSPEVKSVGRSYCLSENEYDKRIVLQNIYELCEEISIKLRRLGKKGKTVGVYLGGSGSYGGRKTVCQYFESGKDIFEICIQILKNNNFNFEKDTYVRRMSIWATGLEDSVNITVSLFSFENKKEKLLETVDKINDKFGDHTIRNAFLLYADKLTTVPNGFLADKFERTKFAKISA